MKEKDVKDVPSKGFSKSWWTKHRSRKCHGSGVGKALDAWNAAKMPPQSGKIESFTKGTEFAAAYAAIQGLSTAMKTAKSKAQKGATDTLKAIVSYESEIKKYKQKLDTIYTKKLAVYKKDREWIKKATTTRLSADEKDLKLAQSYVIQAESREKAAMQLVKAGKGDEADQYVKQVETLLAEAKKCLKNMEDRQEKQKAEELRIKGTNANAVGIMEEDAKKLNPLFHDATQNIFACTAAQNKANVAIDQIEDHLEAIRDIASGASKDLMEWITLLQEVNKRTTTLAGDNPGGLTHSAVNVMTAAKTLQETLSKKELTQRDAENARLRLDGVRTHQARLPQKLQEFKKLITQRNRMPKEFENHPTIRKLVGEIEKSAKTAKTQTELFTKAAKLAEKTYEAIEKKASVMV